ncbi:MAG: TlpA family protein disulfide reductase [Bacteroidales bacterium]|nr:TlpA family protein disulfide reductase [Bacteroidales bacterium]
MKLILAIFLTIAYCTISWSQTEINPNNYPSIKNKAELSTNQGKTALVFGKLVAFQPINEGVTEPIEKWEWEIILSDGTKIPVRGNTEKEKFESLVNEDVRILGEIIIGKTSENEEQSGFRIVYKDIFPLTPVYTPTDLMEVTEGFDNYPRLKEIFEKYKGKVILVDFWASHCKPCMKEMKSSASLHDELKEKEIVFLYLAYMDQKKNWESAKNRLKIEGEHILLDNETIKEVKSLFKIIGIPWYVVIGKDGKIVKNKAPRPSNPELKELLLKEIAK